jgi:arylsulfatase
MIDRMDREIGRVLDQLREMGVLDDTLILFLSDNGASAEIMVRGDGHDPSAPAGSAATFLSLGPGWSSAANAPLRRHKTWVHEGGISTPFILHWPKGIEARGELRREPAHVIDLVPTVLELAGGRWPSQWEGTPVPAPSGRSLVPVLRKEATLSREYLWWSHEGNRALRAGDWKIVAAGKNAPWELYDLSADRGELRDLAVLRPEKARELADLWAAVTEEFRRKALEDLPAETQPSASPPSASPPSASQAVESPGKASKGEE